MCNETYDRLCAFVQCILDGLQSSNNSLIAGDFTLFDGNVEVNTEKKKIDKNFFNFQSKVVQFTASRRAFHSNPMIRY
jgi:hypothetical protein